MESMHLALCILLSIPWSKHTWITIAGYTVVLGHRFLVIAVMIIKVFTTMITLKVHVCLIEVKGLDQR